MRYFSNQGSALEYFTCCHFCETNTGFQILKEKKKRPALKWFLHMSSICEFRQGFVQQSSHSHKFYSFFPFFLYSSFSCSLQLLSVSYLSCQCHFTCHPSSCPWHCILMLPAHSQTYSIQPLRELSLPVPSWQPTHFLFPWVMLFFFHFLIHSAFLAVLLEYKCISFPGSTLPFHVIFPCRSEFPALGIWLSDSHLTPTVQQSL